MTTYAAPSDKFIHIFTNKYPLNINQISAMQPTFAFGKMVDLVLLQDLGYEKIHPVEKPEGDIVNEGTPEYRDGHYYQTWEVRNYSPEELISNFIERKESLKYILKDKFEEKLKKYIHIEKNGETLLFKIHDQAITALLASYKLAEINQESPRLVISLSGKIVHISNEDFIDVANKVLEVYEKTYTEYKSIEMTIDESNGTAGLIKSTVLVNKYN